MQQLANFIVDHDPMMVLRRTHDTMHYIRWAWNKDHADPIDEEELRLFLCDEHYGDLTDEQKAVARRSRDEMRSVYAEPVSYTHLDVYKRQEHSSADDPYGPAPDPQCRRLGGTL